MAEGVKPDHDDVRKVLHGWVDRMCDEALTIDANNKVGLRHDREAEVATGYAVRELDGTHKMTIEWTTKEALSA